MVMDGAVERGVVLEAVGARADWPDLNGADGAVGCFTTGGGHYRSLIEVSEICRLFGEKRREDEGKPVGGGERM